MNALLNVVRTIAYILVIVVLIGVGSFVQDSTLDNPESLEHALGMVGTDTVISTVTSRMSFADLMITAGMQAWLSSRPFCEQAKKGYAVALYAEGSEYFDQLLQEEMAEIMAAAGCEME